MSHRILEPITASSPCGDDYKYEDAFLAVEAEIDKSTSMLENVATDWSKIAVETEAILSQHTKDIKVMCWWVYASYKQNSLQGLEEALVVFNDFLTTFKAELFPKSKKVKFSSLLWLEELLNGVLLDEKGAISVNVDVKKFSSYFMHLEKNFALVTQEEKPVFTKLQRVLATRLESEKHTKKTSVASTENSATTKPSNGASIYQEAPTEITSNADAIVVLRLLKKNAAFLHEYYRQQDIADVIAIRLVRFISWLEVSDLPQTQNGKTVINPPSSESIDKIEALITDKEYEKALECVENLISRSPFWLEGHLISFTLLTELGYNNAANEVKNALLGFVKRDSGVLNFSFKDTTPFASVKLKKWLAESMVEPVTKDAPKEQNSSDEEKEHVIESAYALAKKKNIKEAMKLLQKHSTNSATKEDEFCWHLIKAELAVEFGKKDLALALLDDLKKDIDTYRLDEWNPELAARVFCLFLGFDRTQVSIEEKNTTYARLCKIDIEKALEIKL